MPEPTVTISRRGVDRFVSSHPWTYRSDVVGSCPLKGGEVVRVVDQRGWFLGRAFYSAVSQIALRRLTRDNVECDESFFRERLTMAKRLRETVYPGETVWRAVHGESDLMPGLVVDRYGDYLSVQFMTQGPENYRKLFCDLLEDIYRPKGIMERSDGKVRLLEGLEQRKGVIRGTVPDKVEYQEGNIKVVIDLLNGQKTGSFLDQRENRLAVRRYARGRGLDCFSYVGGFALQLAKCGCEHVTAVEFSEEMSPLIAANAKANGITNLEVVTANAFDFLKAQSEIDTRYDIIILDPPAFARSKTAIESAQRGYKEINLRALHLLKPGGILVSASCSFHISEDHFEEILFSAASDVRKEIQIVEKRGAGRDHPVHLGTRETRYLKCYILRVV
jgi:23S rRNA (cytosine1962-C5)-methyltransferase